MKEVGMIEKKGIFNSIKTFFVNLFSKEKNNKNIEEKQTEKNEFKKEIVVPKDEEKERLLQLQKKFREGNLTPAEITDDEIDKLCSLYDEQIKELKEKIEMNKEKVEKYRKQAIET